MAWYRGNLHMHSYWTDGHDFPEMIADRFRDMGYHFIAFTEHDRHQVGEKWVSRDRERGSGRSMSESGLFEKYVQRFGEDWVETRGGSTGEVRVKALAEYRHRIEQPGEFLILTGEEVTASWGDVDDWCQTHWINVFNTAEAVAPSHSAYPVDAMRATLEATADIGSADEAPVLASLNHPNFGWNATAESIAAVGDLRHMEIYTALNMCETFGDDLHCNVERIWDVALALRRAAGGDLIYGLATDDCHAYAHHFEFGDTALPGRAWIQVQAEELTTNHLLSAIHRGDFYCSSGVVLDEADLAGDGMALQIRFAPGVAYTTRFIGTLKGTDLSSEPVLDGSGQPVPTTRTYSPAVGQILHETTDTSPSYAFTGDELYVRAVVTSSTPHPNPTCEGDVERAWTQPVVPGV